MWRGSERDTQPEPRAPAMPLTQEKRLEMSFTNNNDHNYLHKKFKKLASTVPRSDGHSSESDSSQYNNGSIPHTSSYSTITNRSISAAHPEIEKIKDSEIRTTVERQIGNIVQNILRSQPAEAKSRDDEKTEMEEKDAGVGRYTCLYCGLSCSKPSVLRKHIRAHTNERPYPCDQCGIAFKTKSNLYKHCRSQSHALRSRGENAPPMGLEDFSGESESDTSLPPPDTAETRLSFEGESLDLPGDRNSPAVYESVEDTRVRSIYKPKFHRASSYRNDDKHKVLSSNPSFLNEHISKIISDNEAIVDVLETPLQKKYARIKHIPETKQPYEDNFDAKSDHAPLNLSKNSDEAIRRKRSHSESFAQLDHNKHSLNPEGSIIKDLLLKTRMFTTGLLPVTNVEHVYDSVATHNMGKMELQRPQYGRLSNGVPDPSLSPREVVRNFEREHVFMRSNSIDVTLPESHSPRSMLRSPSNNIPYKPDNLLIIKPEGNDVVPPLPSPGPLLGNTRLVDSRVDSGRSKPPSNTVKRKLDTRSEAFNVRVSEDMLSPRLDSYPQKKSRQDFQPMMRPREELSHSPLRKPSSLQMFGGEVKIISNSGSTTTLRIEPTRQLSPIVVPRPGSPKHGEGEASNIVQSGLHSGGTIMHNHPTPKETTSSQHPQTPRIMISIAANVPTPNLTVTSVPMPEIAHFRFPPLGAITAYNPLTLPPLSPSPSPNGSATILHGGKLIPHVPGIPGPNTPVSYTPQIKYPQNGEYALLISPKEDPIARTKIQNYDAKLLSPSKSSSQSSIRENTHQMPNPRFKIRPSQTPNQAKYSEKPKDIKHFMSEATKVHVSLNVPVDRTGVAQPPVTIKINEPKEARHFNFENLITKAEIYNSVTKQQKSVQEPLTISVQTPERSETSYFQKNMRKEESKSKFLRPSSLPLKPGTFTPKKHHGITPNANTMPLISPETPRPAKAYGQLYLNGNAYTYLGLKCSTKVFYCTLNRPQPTYVPNQVSLSMYCNWQILMEQAPHPLGVSPLELMALYDSRHRPSGVAVAHISTHHILTHSSQWNATYAVADSKHKSSVEDKKSPTSSRSTTSTSSSGSKELAGGFESNEEYTYVRGRGRGRYVCGECGIRCKKPSMLKKHVRTHTNVRPYTCQHCAFSFKTKGNLTKHMKSKAHYKKCSELGISPDVEGGDSPDQNENSGDSDTDSDPDEGETESSDTDSWKSRLPEHEAAHCLLSLSRPAQPAPGLLSTARPNTYPYTPMDDAPQADHPEPMDLSRSEIRPEPSVLDSRESSVLASLASNTAALPPAATSHPHEPMLHAYLTERALMDTRIKQSQCVTTQAELHTTSSSDYMPNAQARVESFGGVVTYTKPPTEGVCLSMSVAPRVLTTLSMTASRLSAVPSMSLAPRPSLTTSSALLATRVSPTPSTSLAPRSSSMPRVLVTPPSTSLAPLSSPATSLDRVFTLMSVAPRVVATPPLSPAPRASSTSPTSIVPRAIAPATSHAPRTSTVPISLALRVSGALSTVELRVSAPLSKISSPRLYTAQSTSLASRATEPSPSRHKIPMVTPLPLRQHVQAAELSLVSHKTQSTESAPIRLNAHSAEHAQARLQVQPMDSVSLRINAQSTETAPAHPLKPAESPPVQHQAQPAAPVTADPVPVNTSTENAKFVASEYLKMAQKDDTPNDKGDESEGDRFKGNKGGTVVIRVGDMTDYPPYTPARVAADGRAVCTVCDKSFSKSSQLRLHINIHYMERPFRCTACAVSFRTRGHLQKHERSSSHRNKASMTSTFGAATSANPRPFRCSDCNIAFRIHGHLAKHLRSKMHVMRLECLSKLPFGTFAEMERAGVSLTDIDTSDCENSLASLQLLAQRLHERDPSKLEAWAPTMLPAVLPPGDTSDDEQTAPAPDAIATDT